MNDFNIAVELVLKHEGGFVDDPLDPGGRTNFGISQRAFPLIDIAKLKREDAIVIYQNNYWKKWMSDESQVMGNCLLDCAVNQGLGACKEMYDANPVLEDFQVARLLRYAADIAKHPEKRRYAHSWFARTLDV